MIAGHHLIWSAYGTWLPNDPRGSSSHEIRNPLIAELGELHYGRKRVQPARADLRRFYDQAQPVLQYKPYLFSDDEIVLLGDVFAQTIRRRGYTCYGCAIMIDHVHMLIRKHRDRAETMIEQFQDDSKAALLAAQMRPAGHPVWGGPGWKVFLDTREDMVRIAKYIRDNPLKAGHPAQQWGFVQEYDGWLPGIGIRR
jgi:REP element-mobilizing transposase RayT